MAKCIVVNISVEELQKNIRRLESFICHELRCHSIPVKGWTRFKGVWHGVMSMKRNGDNSATFRWWPTVQDALDDGVAVPDSPESKAKEEALRGIIKIEVPDVEH